MKRSIMRIQSLRLRFRALLEVLDRWADANRLGSRPEPAKWPKGIDYVTRRITDHLETPPPDWGGK